MRTVEEIQADLKDLTREELRRVRDFLDDLVEDDFQFTDEFEGQIREAEAQMDAGMRPRVKRP